VARSARLGPARPPSERARLSRRASQRRTDGGTPCNTGGSLELKTTGPGGQRLWAYRYRLDGRGSRRIQRGEFATPDDALEALEHALTATQRRKGRVRVTLADSTYGHLARDNHQHAIELLDRYHTCDDVDAGGRSVDVGTIAPPDHRPTEVAC
jgi:hypothetical protein